MTNKDLKHQSGDRPAEEENAASTDRGAASDKHLWYFWMGLMIVAVTLLPFIVREGALVRAIADMCMTALGL